MPVGITMAEATQTDGTNPSSVTVVANTSIDAGMDGYKPDSVFIANDDNDQDSTSVGVIDPLTGNTVTTLIVENEGTWTIDSITGEATFIPEPGFTGTPTPIADKVTDNTDTESISYPQYGTVYEDTNGNGIQDQDEQGLPNVTVTVTDVTGEEHKLTTDTNGNYAVSLPVGDTEILIDESTLPEGSTQTQGANPTIVTVRESDVAIDIDGFEPDAALTDVSGVVYEDTNNNNTQDADESGIEGVTVTVVDSLGGTQTVTTDTDGNYIAKVPEGDVTITIDESTLPSGFTQTEGTNPSTLMAVLDTTVTDVDGYTQLEQ